jgi:hypothetical protein
LHRLLQDFAGTYTEKPSVSYTQTAGSDNYKLAAFQPTQKSNWILLQFDLSFLSSLTKVSSAELHIFVSSVNVETKQLTKAVIDVYDGSKTQQRNGKTFPCVPPFCTTARKVGMLAVLGCWDALCTVDLLATMSSATAARFCHLVSAVFQHVLMWAGRQGCVNEQSLVPNLLCCLYRCVPEPPPLHCNCSSARVPSMVLSWAGSRAST